MSETLFGRYRLLGMLGEGGMAQVHLAEDPSLHRCVALKVIRPNLSMRSDWIRRFHQEATTVARLGNPHVIQVYDLGNQDGQEFLVMEFLDRGSLEKILAKQGGKLDPVCAACVAVQAAEGLRAAHEAGVVHRDVKPDNLLVSREGVVKVADFGIARLQDEISKTQTGTALGSPQFMAPEQIEGTPLSGKADVFALAGVMHLMLAGTHPFQAEQAHALMWRIVSQDAPDLRTLDPSLPEDLTDIVKLMHARDLEIRPVMGEVVHSLRMWLALHGVLDPILHLRTALGFPNAPRMDAQGLPTTQVMLLQKRKPKRRLPRWALWVGGGVALTALVGTAIWSGAHWLSQGSGKNVMVAASAATGDESAASGSLMVLAKDEAPQETSAMKPRISVRNTGDKTIHALRIAMTVNASREPVVETWYAPNCKVELSGLGSGAWRLVARCRDLELKPGEEWPGGGGLSIGIHYPDWKPMEAKKDFGLGARFEPAPWITVSELP